MEEKELRATVIGLCRIVRLMQEDLFQVRKTAKSTGLALKQMLPGFGNEHERQWEREGGQIDQRYVDNLQRIDQIIQKLESS
jgi:hypothetical protein